MNTHFVSACDEKKKDGFVRVIVAIKNLETSTEIVRKGILPKAVKKPSNAKLESTFENQYGFFYSTGVSLSDLLYL